MRGRVVSSARGADGLVYTVALDDGSTKEVPAAGVRPAKKAPAPAKPDPMAERWIAALEKLADRFVLPPASVTVMPSAADVRFEAPPPIVQIMQAAQAPPIVNVAAIPGESRTVVENRLAVVAEVRLPDRAPPRDKLVTIEEPDGKTTTMKIADAGG